MFFLISYGLLNYATYYEAKAASPSFRPTFKFFHGRLSLLGALACLGVMLAIDPATGITATAILFAIFQYLKRTGGPARWADGRRGYHLQRIRENLLAAGATPEHPRDWRPQIIAFSQDRGRRSRLLRMSAWLEGGSGLTTVIFLIQGRGPGMIKARETAEKELLQDVREHHPDAFPLVVVTPHLETGLHTLLQAHGIGPLHVNTILLNWLNPHSMTSEGFREYLFGRQLRTLYRLGCNILVLYTGDTQWERVSSSSTTANRIDVWWSGDASSRLMLLFAYLMTRAEDWEKADIRLLALCETGNEEEIETVLSDELENARINASFQLVTKNDAAGIVEASADSTLVFLPFRLSGNLIQTLVPGRVENLLEKLPTTVLVMAAEDIDLGAEPEEGKAAELAEALDDLQEQEKKAEEKQKAVTAAQKAADIAQQRYLEALASIEKMSNASSMADGTAVTYSDEELLRLKKEAEKTAETAEQVARRAAKAQAKVQDAKKAVEP